MNGKQTAGTAPLPRLAPAYKTVGLNKLRAVQAGLLLRLASEVWHEWEVNCRHQVAVASCTSLQNRRPQQAPRSSGRFATQVG